MSENSRYAINCTTTSEMPEHRLDCAFFLNPEAVAASAMPRFAMLSDITGRWETVVQMFQHPVHIVFFISPAQHQLTARFACPEAGLLDMAVQEIHLSRDIVRLEMDDFESGFTGVLNPLTRRIEGIFSHGGFRFPATLIRTEGRSNGSKN